MSEAAPPRPSRWRGWLLYGLTVLVVAGATVGVTALLLNIRQRKDEGRQYYLELAQIDPDTVDAEKFKSIFPRQYDGYARTATSERTRPGRSESINETDADKAPSRLEADPRLKTIFAGYAFSIDFRERRGHAFMLQDQDQTKRVTEVKQPGACLHCHSSIIPAYRKAGDGDVMKGFEALCKMPLKDARKLVGHPVSCIDCHDVKTMQLRVTRPGFLNGIAALAAGYEKEENGQKQRVEPELPAPLFGSIHKWRQDRAAFERRHPGKDFGRYDPNVHASRQEMRSFVCGQCHVEYYFTPEGKVVTYPWSHGLRADEIEAYYDELGFTDWVHALAGTKVIKAQHPEFELWSQGIHARSGVACADCHMPYMREGAIKISDHHVRSPMLNIARACQTCHRYPESEIASRVQAIQGRHRALMSRAEDAVVDAIKEIAKAKKGGASDEELKEARRLHRKAQWRLDFVNAENSMGFHAPQEAARLLGEALDDARKAQMRAALLKR